MNPMLAILSLLSLLTIVHSDETISISSSCNDKEVDGLYYIKPTKTGSIIPVICNNGYTMLDASLNFDQLSTYFTSIYRYGTADKIIYGTDCGDTAGWRDWYTPANDATKFRVAKGCLECAEGGIYGDNTAYYMTNGYFCPVNLDIDGCSPHKDMTGQTQPDVMCNICDDEEGICGTGEGRDGQMLLDSTIDPSWCDCYTLQLTADHKTVDEHKQYCQADLNWRPNLLVDRSQCTCYKPAESENKVYHDISMDDLPLVSADYRSDLESLGLYIDDNIQWDEDEESEDVNACRKKYTYLTNEDFQFGTYRILECGNYVLTEDIVLNFNKPLHKFSYEEGDSPNSYSMDNLHWFPTTEQQESGQYFGLDAFWGAFSIGFFAGISVETNHVYIDLDGHSIEMEYQFYLQQRFFAIIELGNKQFEARQGPVDFGRDDLKLKDIKIENGYLGLTSHHGIHGAAASDITISNLNILNFDVGGIQCNGCKKMLIEDIKIGPQNVDIPVLGRYVHGRIILSRLRYLVDEYGDETLHFANRAQSTTVKELADRLVEQMDMIYYHVIDGIEFDDNDKQWQLAKETFLNPTGWLDGGSAYGILLNGEGTAVVNIGRRTTNTYDITVKNVEIHDLMVNPRENFWAESADGDGNAEIVHGFFFETIDWNYGNVYDKDTGYYLGDAYTDILFAANEFFQTDFCPLGSLFYMDGLRPWAFTDGYTISNDHSNNHVIFLCGSDIQSHSAKGAIGIRIDGVQDFSVEDVYIHDIVNWGDLGSDACGEYEQITFETGVDVDKDIQYGYSGDNVHGILTDYASGSIKNVKVENLESWHGSTHGIAIYKGSTAEFDGQVSFNNLIAGSKLSQKESDALILPNAKPFICSIFVGPNSDVDTNPEYTPVTSTTDDFDVLITNKMYGYDYCGEDERVGDMDEPSTPESLLNVNDMNRIITNSVFAQNYSSMIVLMISMFVIIGLLITRKVVCGGNSKAKKKWPVKNYGSTY